MVITRLLPSHYQPFSFTASDARGSQASLSAPNNGSRWRRLAAPGASIYSRSWEGRETSPWGEKGTLPPPPSTPVVGKAGKRRRGERREHCRRLLSTSCCWKGRETASWGEKKAGARRCRAPAFFSSEKVSLEPVHQATCVAGSKET